MNLAQVPMWILSGVFFSAQRFPDAVQPFISALPLTALIDALRAHMLQGAGLVQLAPQLGVLDGVARGLFRAGAEAVSLEVVWCGDPALDRRLRLRNPQRRADHRAAARDVDQRERVQQRRADAVGAEPQIVVDAAEPAAPPRAARR